MDLATMIVLLLVMANGGVFFFVERKWFSKTRIGFIILSIAFVLWYIFRCILV